MKTRKLMAIVCAMAMMTASFAQAADGTWTADASDNWSATNRWSGDTVADGADSTASFTANITAARTITNDIARIIGNITFTDSTTDNANLTISGANTLTLDRTDATAPTINVTQSARTLTISSPIAGSDGLQKNGAGTLTLSGSNTYSGGTVHNAGTIAFGANNDTYLGATSGGLTFNGGQITYSDDFALNRNVTVNSNWALNNRITVNGVLSGSSSISQSGSDGATFANTGNTFTGTINSGYAMTFTSLGDSSNPYNFGNSAAAFTWTGGAKTFALRPFTFSTTGSGQIRSSGTGALVIQQNLAITGTAGSRTLELGGTYTGLGNTFAGSITNGTGSTVSLTKGADASIWALPGTNTYTGATTLPVVAATAAASGAFIFQGIQALSPDTSLRATSSSGNGGKVPGTFKILDDSASPASRSGVNLSWTGANGQDPFTIFVGNNNTANGGNSSGTTTDSTITLGNMTFTQTAGSTAGLRFDVTGANGYKLQINNVSISVPSYAGAWNTKLNPTTAPLTVTGNVQQVAGGTGTVNLQLDGTAAGNLISGNILNSADGTPKPLSVTKLGTGDWTLSGSNSYTGGTTITTGKLLFSGANALPATGTVAVGANGHLSLADGTAQNNTVSALTLTSLANLSFDWTGDSAGDQLTSTDDITPTAGSRIVINLNRSGTPGGSVTLLNGGASSTLSSSSFYLANLTNYTAALTVAATTVSVGSYAAATPLTTLYWTGNKLAAGGVAGVDNSWTLSDGTKGNWSSTTTAYTATPLTPGATANVIFANGQADKAQQSTVLGSDVTANSVTIDDGTAVTISGANGEALTLMSSLSTAGLVDGTPGSAITVTSTANAASTISSRVNLGANQTWNVANGKTLTVSGEVAGNFSLTKADAGKVILNGVNTFTGGITINSGTLQIGVSSTANNASLNRGNYAGDISIATGASLDIQSNADQILSGVISGGGNLLKRYIGTLTLAGANTYSGKTTLGAIQNTPSPTLVVSSFNSVSSPVASSSLGRPTTVANGTIELGSNNSSPNPVLKYIGTGETTDRVINFIFNSNARRTLDASGPSGLLKFTSSFTGSGGTTQPLDLTGTGAGEIAGNIPAFSGGTITKNGSGTWTLSGTNGYMGATTISVGTLIGVVGGSCANSAVTVAANANLGIRVADKTKQWTCKSLTFGAASANVKFTFDVDGSHALAPLSITDALTFTGVPTVVVDTTNLVGGDYPLLTAGTPPSPLTVPPLLISGSLSGTLEWRDNTLYLVTPPVIPSGTLIQLK